jgi:hypothetical protein
MTPSCGVYDGGGIAADLFESGDDFRHAAIAFTE